MEKQEIIKSAQQKMESVLGGVKKDFIKIRTGKASTDLVTDVHVECYGTQMPLNQVATLSVPEPRLIVINPFDKQTIGAIEKGIQKSDLGVTPGNDGNVIRINLPPLSEDRRKELIKMARHAAEEGRVHVRNVRREANEHLKKAQKEGKLSEDDFKRTEKDVQKMTDDAIAKIDEALHKKEAETLEF